MSIRLQRKTIEDTGVMNSNWAIRALVVMCWLSTGVIAEAGEYVITKGQRFELCRELAENLNTFKDEPPLLCGLKLNPKYTNFRFPKWEMMDVRENVEIVQMVLHSTPLSKWNQERIENRQLILQKGAVDINSDGRPNTVYRVEMLDCDVEKLDYKI